MGRVFLNLTITSIISFMLSEIFWVWMNDSKKVNKLIYLVWQSISLVCMTVFSIIYTYI